MNFEIYTEVMKLNQVHLFFLSNAKTKKLKVTHF